MLVLHAADPGSNYWYHTIPQAPSKVTQEQNQKWHLITAECGSKTPREVVIFKKILYILNIRLQVLYYESNNIKFNKNN